MRKKGRRPGRYVPPHIRENYYQPGTYTNVADYQEHIHPAPSKLIDIDPQGELDLETDPDSVGQVSNS